MTQGRLSDKAILVVFGTALERLGSFVLVAILVRLLSQGDYGTFRQVWTVGTIFYGLFSGGIAAAVYFFFPTLAIEKRRGLVIQVMAVMFALGLLASGILFLSGGFIASRFHNPALAPLLMIYSLNVLFWIASDYFPHLLLTRGKYILAIATSVGHSLTNMVALAAPLLLGYGLNTALWSFSLVAVARFAIYSIYTWFTLPPGNVLGGKKLLKDQIAYSLPLSLGYSLIMLAGTITSILVSLYFPVEAFAIYSIGVLSLPLWQLITKSVNTVLRVKFAELHKERNYRRMLEIYREAVRKQALIIVPIVVFLLAAADLFITLFFTNLYRDSVLIFRITLIGQFAAVASFSLIPESIGKTKITTMASLIILAVNFPLTLALIKAVGLVGPAIASVIASYLACFYYLRCTRQAIQAGYSDIFPWRSLLTILMMAAIAGAAVYPLSFLGMPKVLNLMLMGLVFSLSYMFLTVKLRVFTPGDRALVARWIMIRPLLERSG